MMDASVDQLQRAKSNIRVLQTSFRRKRRKVPLNSVSQRWACATNSAEDAGDADLIVEAAPKTRAQIRFVRWFGSDPVKAILASNTSLRSVRKITAATQRPDQVIGMHFMNPVPLMQLVEVIRRLATPAMRRPKPWCM